MEEYNEEQLADVKPLIETLFDLSCDFVSKFGNFLPHGASLDQMGDVTLCAAAPENERTDATEVLPLLHEGLRAQTSKLDTLAVAVSESVFIGPDMTPAIKVLVEHRAGMTLAYYLPWKKRMLRKPTFGEMVIQEAEPEVGQWQKPPFLA